MKQYEFKKQNNISKIAIEKVSNYLNSLEETLYVENVELDKEFQEFDIDLIQFTHEDVFNIEVKADTYDTGNFFFETVSNESKNTLGCFMYTSADFIYYYFLKKDILYILPMPECRKWFISNQGRFEQKKLATRKGKKILYYSYGYAVPIKTILEEVGAVERKL